MLKAIFAATAAVTIAASTAAYAQRDGRSDGARRWQPTTEDIRAFQAARLAALRAGLVLNAEQEKHWPAFEQAMRALQQQRLNRVTAMRDTRREGRPTFDDPAERMRQRATRLSESGAVLKQLADATDPLYRSLDDAQKRRFAILSRTAGPRGGMWQRRGRDGGEPGMQRGQRRTDVMPAEVAPPFERMVFDGDTAFDGKAMFANKAIATEPALLDGQAFGDKAFGGKAAAFGKHPNGNGKSLGFSRKITIGEPVDFDSNKMPRDI